MAANNARENALLKHRKATLQFGKVSVKFKDLNVGNINI